MNSEMSALDNHATVDYASNVCGVCIWHSSQDGQQGIALESTHFLMVYGHKHFGGGKQCRLDVEYGISLMHRQKNGIV